LLIFVVVSVSRDFELGTNSAPYGANLFHLLSHDKNTEQVEKCAVILTCTLTLLHVLAHPHCKG